jgi:glycine/D-amino acid oxidase-like deaminating enzyme
MPSMSSRRCVVIGAGILGASVADALASAGQRVMLLDRDQPGHGTSRWSLAWLNSNDKAPRPYHDLNHAGMKAWAELAPDLDGAAWYRPAGHVELATADTAELEARVRRLTAWGYPARLVDPAEATAIEPALRLPGNGSTAAAWFPGEGYLLAPDAAEAVDLHTPEHERNRWADELLRRARRTVRGLDDARVAESKVCVRPLPADGHPIVGPVPGTNGRYIAVTHSGVTLAAHLARLITEELITGTPPAALTPYRPARFR